MDNQDKDKLSKLLGKDYIERKVKKQVIKGKNGAEAIIDYQKVTGSDENGGIVDAELDKITEYDCQCVAEGRANYGGRCAVCGATFCNKMLDGKPSCYRKCAHCHRKICMKHVRGLENDPVLCSFNCVLSYNLKRLLRDNLGTVIIVCAGIILLILGLMKSRH